MCRRAFGSRVCIDFVRELGMGSINNVYRVQLANLEPMILRVAPAPGNDQALEDEAFLMRREYNALPFFAPVASLLPRPIMADFTHQVVDRDYVFQTLVVGDVWGDINEELSPTENEALWRQLGSITKEIHSVAGEAFGDPYPLGQLPTWSRAVLADAEAVLRELERRDHDAFGMRVLLDIVFANQAVLDEVVEPRLLHGDIDVRHVFVQRGNDGPKIVGLIDSEFARWGDPLAESMLVRMRLAPPPGSSAFWETYGESAQSLESRFRTKLYDALAMGRAQLETERLGDDEGLAWVRTRFAELILTLGSGVRAQV